MEPSCNCGVWVGIKMAEEKLTIEPAPKEVLVTKVGVKKAIYFHDIVDAAAPSDMIL